MYTFESRIRYSELDQDRKLSVASIVDYFQDCSTFQSESLGVGFDYLESRKLLWVMSYWQIVVDRYARLGEKVTVGTYPYEFRSFMGLRNFFMDDESGRRIVRANSLWTLMDMQAGRPVRASQDMLDAYRLEPKLEMDYEPRRICLTGEGVKEQEFQVGRQNLDSNHHVNNGQYIYMAQNYLPEGCTVGQMRAEYRKQALLHDRIVPVVYRQEDRVAVALCDTAGAPYAVVEFKLLSASGESRGAC